MQNHVYRILVIGILAAMLLVPSTAVFAQAGTNDIEVCTFQSAYASGPSWTNEKNFQWWGFSGGFQLFNNKHGTEVCHALTTTAPAGTFTFSQVIYSGWAPFNITCYGQGAFIWSWNSNDQAFSVTFPGNNSAVVNCSLNNYDTTIGFH